MNNNFIPYSAPEISQEEIDLVIEVLRSDWITTGPKCKEFEQNFKDFLGHHNNHAIAVNSATAGLHLALEAFGIREDDEVITTTHTFTATAEVIRYLGAKPVFVDIDPNTLCIDPLRIEQVITSRTKAIIPVHFAGHPADIKQIIHIAKKYKLKIIEDAAHAFPSKYDDQLIGNLDTDATVFSFYANKTITTGEGGMVVTKDSRAASRIRTMRLHGISKDSFDRFTSKVPSWYYEVVAPGYKYNMTDISAAIGIAQLKKANRFQAKRQFIAKEYTNSFRDLDITLPPIPKKNDMHSWHLYVIRLPKNSLINRNDLIDKLYANGIGCSVHYIPLQLHPYWKQFCNPLHYPVSNDIYERSISLPIYSKMTMDNIKNVISKIRMILHA